MNLLIDSLNFDDPLNVLVFCKILYMIWAFVESKYIIMYVTIIYTRINHKHFLIFDYISKIKTNKWYYLKYLFYGIIKSLFLFVSKDRKCSSSYLCWKLKHLYVHNVLKIVKQFIRRIWQGWTKSLQDGIYIYFCVKYIGT